MAVISAPPLYAPRGPTLSEKISMPLGVKEGRGARGVVGSEVGGADSSASDWSLSESGSDSGVLSGGGEGGAGGQAGRLIEGGWRAMGGVLVGGGGGARVCAGVEVQGGTGIGLVAVSGGGRSVTTRGERERTRTPSAVRARAG